MKTIITFLLFTLFSLNVMAAETLSFKLANPRIEFYTPDNYLVFDVMIKASAGGTYLYGSQVVCNIVLSNFNSSVPPTVYKGSFIDGNFDPPGLPPPAEKYSVSANYNSDNLNIALIPNISFNSIIAGAHAEITTSWQTVFTVYCVISNTSGIAGISFQPAAMDGYQTFATGIGPTYSDTYASPNIFEGYDFTDLYLGRIFSEGSTWTQAGGTVNWATSVNTSVWDGNATLAATNALATNLRIHEAATLAINQPGSLTVSGTLTNASTSGNNGLVLKSTAAGTGSLIHNNPGVNATVERYIASPTNWVTATNDGWHLLSSPVDGQAITNNGTWTPNDYATADDYDFYALDETNTTGVEYWLNEKANANGANFTTFVNGQGYLVAYEATGTKQFAGTLHVSDVPLSLSYTAGNPIVAHQGWNLAGNPFASALNWDAGSWTGASVDNVAQVWDENGPGYKTTVQISDIIPSMNGFMVHTSVNGAILTIPASARVHNAANWYKASEENFILLVANDNENGSSQSSVVRFNAEATEGYDTKFDSYFLKGFAPQFYSVSGSESYALNTLPEMKDFLEIPFAFVKNGSGSFSIELAKNLPDAVVYLIDKKTDVTQNLTENPVYAFTAAEGDQADRFILHFGSQFLGLNPSNANSNFSVWYNRGDIQFSTLPEKVLSMSLIDMAGREIVNLGKPESDKVSVGKKLATGYYMVRIRMADKVVVKKLFIN